MTDYICSELDLADNNLLPLVLSNRLSFHFVREFLNTFGQAFNIKWGDEFSEFQNHFEWDDKVKVKFKQKLLNNGMVIDEHIEEILFDNDELIITQEYIDIVHSLLKTELAGQLWGRAKYFRVVNDYLNGMFRKANELWDESERIHELTVQKL